MFARLKHALRSYRKAAGPLPRRKRDLAPTVTTLESREVMSTLPPIPNGPTLFTNELYRDLLNRAPTPGELRSSVNYLQTGGDTGTLAHNLITSSERKARLIVYYYEDYLGRNPDATGFVFNLDALNHGATQIDVQRWIIKSPEFQSAHATNTSYVTALYNDILSVAPDAPGQAYWVKQLNAGATRDSVAVQFFNSAQYVTRVVNADYNLVLHRNATANEVKYWAPNIRTSQQDGYLLTALFTSNENYNNLKNGTA